MARGWLTFNLVYTSISQVLHCQSAFQLGGPQHAFMPRAVLHQVRDFVLSLAKLHEVPIKPFLQPVQVRVDGNMTLWCTNNLFHFCIISQLAEDTLYPTIQIMT